MPLEEGFDIKLDSVDGKGLPANRRLWCYKITVPSGGAMGNYYGFTLDFIGGKREVSNPEHFDKKSASDNDNFEWSDPKFTQTDESKPKSDSNTTTWIGIKPKPNTTGFEKGEIKVCFIGPADGQVGEVSLATMRRVVLPARTREFEVPLGRKKGLEVPVAMIGVQDADSADQEVALSLPNDNPVIGLTEEGKPIYRATEILGGDTG